MTTDDDVPGWFRRAVVGDQVVALKSYRNCLTGGKIYRISGFYQGDDMVSEHGPYRVGMTILGNNIVIFDPRCFRPLHDWKLTK